MKKDDEYFDLIKPPKLEGWMKDEEKVKELIEHLEKNGWMMDEHGNFDCVDEASAMAADALRVVLLPMIENKKAMEKINDNEIESMIPNWPLSEKNKEEKGKNGENKNVNNIPKPRC